MDKDNHHHHAATPTCVLKMNLTCCKQCPVRLNKRLQKMNGVKSVKIDQQQGLVTVSGNIDPVVFTENVSKLGKTAELWSFHKDPSSASTLKDCCSCHGDPTTSDEDDQTPSTNKNGSVLITWQRPEQRTKDKTKKKTKTKKMNPIPAAGAGKDMYFHGPPRPVNGRPMGFQSHISPEPPFSYGYNRPGPPWDPPQYPFDYGFWPGSGSRSRSPPKVNRMMKYTSPADNYLPY